VLDPVPGDDVPPSIQGRAAIVTDLITRLTQAAADAIANERQGLNYEPDRLRSIHVELELAKGGTVIEGRAWIERKTKAIRGDRPMPAGRG